jgi:IS30 family transposase
MSHHQLTQYHRHELGALLAGGKHSLREIARILGFHHSTISREIQRHPWHNYSGYQTASQPAPPQTSHQCPLSSSRH